MKHRNCWVANSSSSSFCILFKGSEEELKEKLIDIFTISEEHPLYEFVNGIVDVIMGDVEGHKFDTIEKYREYTYGDSTDCSESEEVREKIKDGWSFYTGSFSDVGNPIETMLCDNGLHYRSDDIIIECEGGY